MNKPLCFVIMGFGKKTDYPSGKTFDLDKTYQNIIKPAVLNSGYDCIRADEILETGVIDKSMYALLIKADLVIADISTFNPNAIYELGIRHAVRPYSTIIIKEEEGSIPFDLNHERIFKYKHLGEDIGATEARVFTDKLIALISSIKENPKNDSPLYEFIRTIEPPKFSDDEFKSIIKLIQKTDSVYFLVEKAKIHMEKDEFVEAGKLWQRANEISFNEIYYTQQEALCKYKSKQPTPKLALIDAWSIISKLDPSNSSDPETLGISGAIFKRLFAIDNDIESLDKAILFYEKGFLLKEDYYNGENFATCLDLKSTIENDIEEKSFYKIQAKKVRQKIIVNLERMSNTQIDERSDSKWIYASLSNCSLAIGDTQKAENYEKLFLDKSPAHWEIETFNSTKNMIKLI